MSDAPPVEATNESGDEKKRKRRLLLLAFAGVSVLSLSTAGIVAATQGPATTPAAVAAESESDSTPEITPGGLGDDEADDSFAPASESDSLLDDVDTDDVSIIETLWPVSPTTRSPLLPVESPTAPPVSPGAGSDPAPAPQPNPGPQPSTPPQPSPSPGDGTEPPGDGGGVEEPEGPSTPHPGDDSDGEGPSDGTDPEDPSGPSTEEPSTGGEDVANAQQLSLAIQHEAYHLLMHVKGEFDLEEATWRVTQGELPEGLSIDSATGTISGRATAEPGRYVFQLEVANATGILRGWFYMMVAKPIVPDPEPGDGPGENPGTNPGGGGGEDGGSDPSNPSTPEEPTGPTTPGGGTTDPTDPTNPVDPTDPTEPGEGTDPVDPTEPTEPVEPTDPGAEQPTDPTDPTTPVDPTDPGAGTPTDPEPGDGTEVDPADPEIDPGAGGIQIDKLEFTLSPTLSFTVGTEIDFDLGATSSTGLDIVYSAEGLPSWLSIIDGRLQGVAPSITGSFNVTITASNEKNKVTRGAAIHVSPSTISMDTSLLQFVSGQSRVIDLQATNGATNANFVYTIISAPNAAATLEDSRLTATYTAPGSHELLVEAQDTNSPVISRNTFKIPIQVEAVPLTIAADTFASTQYVAMTGSVSAAGGWGGYYFRVIDGALPEGVTLRYDGALIGVARTAGTFTTTVGVTDKEGLTAKTDVTVVVKPNPAITPAGVVDVTGGPTGASFSGDGTRLYVASTGRLSVIDSATNAVLNQVNIGNSSPRGGALSPDGRLYALNLTTGIVFYDAETLVKVSEIPLKSPIDFVWSQDSSRIYVVMGKTAASVELFSYDVATKASLGSVVFGKTAYSWTLKLSADGRVLASAIAQKEAYEIDPESMSVRVFVTAPTNHVAPAPDGTVWIGAGSAVSHVDVATARIFTSYSFNGVSLTSMALSPDGRWLYLTTSTGLLVVDAEDGSEVVRVPIGTASTGGLRVVVSPDGRNVFVTSGSGKTSVFRFTVAD